MVLRFTLRATFGADFTPLCCGRYSLRSAFKPADGLCDAQLNAARCSLLPSLHRLYFWLGCAAGPRPTCTFSASRLSGRQTSVSRLRLHEPFRVYIETASSNRELTHYQPREGAGKTRPRSTHPPIGCFKPDEIDEAGERFRRFRQAARARTGSVTSGVRQEEQEALAHQGVAAPSNLLKCSPRVMRETQAGSENGRLCTRVEGDKRVTEHRPNHRYRG